MTISKFQSHVICVILSHIHQEQTTAKQLNNLLVASTYTNIHSFPQQVLGGTSCLIVLCNVILWNPLFLKYKPVIFAYDCFFCCLL